MNGDVCLDVGLFRTACSYLDAVVDVAEFDGRYDEERVEAVYRGCNDEIRYGVRDMLKIFHESSALCRSLGKKDGEETWIAQLYLQG